MIATVFKLGLLGVFVALTNHDVGIRIAELWGRGAATALAVFSLIWAVGLGALAVAAFLPALWMRLLWAVPVAASTIAGELTWAVSGVHLALYEVVLLWSENAHWAEAAEVYSTQLGVTLAKVALGVVALALPPPKLRLPGGRWALAAPLAAIALICALLVAEAGKGTKALPEQWNAASMAAIVAVRNPLSGLDTQRQPPGITPAGAPLARHVILVVDEAVRGDFIDLNHSRGVTPLLVTHRARLANFGLAVSGNNCSLFSNLILRYGGQREHVVERIRAGASVWSHARAAGFNNVYLDGQQTRGRMQNGMTIVERRLIDSFEQFGQIDRVERAVPIARRVLALVQEDEPSFVLVNLGGSHFPYSRNYPPSAAHSLPAMQPGEPIGTHVDAKRRERLVHSYENSVRWQVESFFEELLGDELSNAIVIYTSDHGQNLMDRGVMLQCNSSDPHVLEGLVPLFALGGPAELRQRFSESARVNHDRASHLDLFPTLLELFGYAPDDFAPRYGRGLLHPLPKRTLAFSYGPAVAFGPDSVRWREMPADLRDLLHVAN